MPNVYAPIPAKQTTITEPVGAELRNVASLTLVTRAIANGVAFLQRALTSPLASISDLAALTAPQDGDVRSVLGFGLYTFKTAATTGLSPFRIAAGDATAGGWVSGTAHQTTVVRFLSPGGQPNGMTSDYAPASTAIRLVRDEAEIASTATANDSLVHNTVNAGAPTGRALVVSLDSVLVDGATITLVRNRVLPIGGHIGLPGLMPKMSVARCAIDGVAVALLSTGGGLATDSSANVVAYENFRWNSYVPDQHNVIDKSQYSYHLILWNEGDTNALAGLTYNGVEVTQTVPDARRS